MVETSTIKRSSALVLFPPPPSSTVSLVFNCHTGRNNGSGDTSGLTALARQVALMSACTINGGECAKIPEPSRHVRYSRICTLTRCVITRLQWVLTNNSPITWMIHEIFCRPPTNLRTFTCCFLIFLNFSIFYISGNCFCQ